jgi:hypothetical protein
MMAPDSNSMRPQDWFGVALRTLGVWTLLKAGAYGLSAIGLQNSWFPDLGANARYYFYFGLADLVAGLLLLLGADVIVGIAYRAPPQGGDGRSEPSDVQ